MHYIDGNWVNGLGEAFDSTCPASGKVVWSGNHAENDECSQAVAAARAAFKIWSQKTFDERLELLERYISELEFQKEAMTLAISKEAGKPLWEAQTEVSAMVAKLNASVKAYHQRTPTTLSQQAFETRLTHRAHGVVVVLGPYNFPGHLPNGQIIPALLAGNTVVFKPSEQTPSVAEMMLSCFEKAGLPNGVINLVQGDGRVGKALLDLDIDGVYFTGSYETGRKIHQHFAGRPEIILALEMGGNNPLIIDETAELDAAVFHTIMSAYITSGQRCTCARRLFVPDNDFGQRFLNQLVEKIHGLTVGPFWQEPEPFMGAVISKQVAAKLIDEEAQLVAMGAERLVSMQSLGEGVVSPGLLDMTESNHHSDDELFGPLLKVWRYQSFNEAMVMANDTRYGLSAGLISDNATHQHIFYQQVRAGIVNINRQITGASGVLPFGGIGKSGNHRPAAAYAADFCAYPMASLIDEAPKMPEKLPQGYE